MNLLSLSILAGQFCYPVALVISIWEKSRKIEKKQKTPEFCSGHSEACIVLLLGIHYSTGTCIAFCNEHVLLQEQTV